VSELASARWFVTVRVAAGLAAALLVVRPLHASSTYQEKKQKVALAHRSLTLTYAKPVQVSQAPPFVVLFASGDGGLRFTSKTIYKHLAEQNFFVAGFSSGEMTKVPKASAPLNVAAFVDDVLSMEREAGRLLGVPETTPIVLVGLSSGASMIVLAGAQPAIQARLAGGVAIALTREYDHGAVPSPEPGVTGYAADDRRRIQTYPLVERMGAVPLAVIQSTNDSYVPAAESRKLLGPDTALRRLFEVVARNHSFHGAKPKMLEELDTALAWIGSR
jgi:type IV secretory pathway VirJ component